MKTLLLTINRMFKKHIARFISIIFIVFVSVGFTSGVGASVDRIGSSITNYYQENNVSDVILKSSAENGFTEEEIKSLQDIYGENNISAGMSLDVNLIINDEKQLVRLYFFDDLDNLKINKLKVIEENNNTENIAFSEVSDNKIKGLNLNTEITLDFADILLQLSEQNNQEINSQLKSLLERLEPKKVKISKIVHNPLMFSLEGEPSYQNPEDMKIPETIVELNDLITLDNVLYLPYSIIPKYSDILPMLEDTPLISKGDIYISFSDKNKFKFFDNDYQNYVDIQIEKIKAIVSEETHCITLYDNYSFYSINSYCQKVRGISILLMIAFLLITGLVVVSNMSRLMEEERNQIACLETMGYSPFSIISRYGLFALTATIIGGIGAYFISEGLCSFIYFVFNYSYIMPNMVGTMVMTFFFITFIAIIGIILISTFIVGHSMTQLTPAKLLRPKTPKDGKKVFIEKIPFIWNRLSFKYKSTLRNVLRYASRFIMTVISVAGAMSLVLVGLALLDICLFQDFGSPAIMGLSIVIVLFAGLLTIVVIYTLTNINISERNREIATLMVLGYHDKEVTGYIYREVYINMIVGIIFGYPLGMLLMLILFSILGFGAISTVTWYVWVVAPVVVFLFTFLVTLILNRKIVKIKMNESLKAIE